MSPESKPQTSLNTGAFPPGTPLQRMPVDTADAGFDAIELTISNEGPLALDEPETAYIEFAKQAQSAGVTVSGLVLQDALEINLASPDDDAARRAAEHVVVALDRAVSLGTDVVILIPGVVGRGDSPSPAIAYEEAYVRSLDALIQLRFDAERRGVRIACVAAANRFLLSPMETREFIDRINSAWVGVCLNPVNLLSIGYPQDWIRSLGHRLTCLHLDDGRLGEHGGCQRFELGEGDIAWSEVMAALREIDYRGPYTYHGRQRGLSDIKSRLNRVLET